MLHTIFANLSTGFNQYTEIYNAFSINENDTDSEVLDKIKGTEFEKGKQPFKEKINNFCYAYRPCVDELVK